MYQMPFCIVRHLIHPFCLLCWNAQKLHKTQFRAVVTRDFRAENARKHLAGHNRENSNKKFLHFL